MFKLKCPMFETSWTFWFYCNVKLQLCKLSLLFFCKLFSNHFKILLFWNYGRVIHLNNIKLICVSPRRESSLLQAARLTHLQGRRAENLHSSEPPTPWGGAGGGGVTFAFSLPNQTLFCVSSSRWSTFCSSSAWGLLTSPVVKMAAAPSLLAVSAPPPPHSPHCLISNHRLVISLLSANVEA